MMTLLSIGLFCLILYLITIFIIVTIKKDASIGNFTWGGGCLLLTMYTFFFTSSYHPRQCIVTLLIAAWCIRLAYYVWLRYKKGADPRYVAWLAAWNNPLKALASSFGWIVIANGFFSLVMALPALFLNIAHHQPSLALLDYCGIALWLLGFTFETVSDYQMYLFKKNPSNKDTILDTGLWRYSRHPNYFGEIVMWWGIYLFALSVPYGWITIVAPAAITILLVWVTGIPWAEQAMAKLPGYKEYQQKTSMLIPWFRKNKY